MAMAMLLDWEGLAQEEYNRINKLTRTRAAPG